MAPDPACQTLRAMIEQDKVIITLWQQTLIALDFSCHYTIVIAHLL